MNSLERNMNKKEQCKKEQLFSKPLEFALLDEEHLLRLMT